MNVLKGGQTVNSAPGDQALCGHYLSAIAVSTAVLPVQDCVSGEDPLPCVSVSGGNLNRRHRVAQWPG